MKRYLLIFCVLLYSLTAWSKDGESFRYNDICYTIISEAESTVKTCDGRITSGNSTHYYPGNTCEGRLELPATVPYNGKRYTLVEIGFMGFYDNKDLTEVILPNTLKVVGREAFYKCVMLSQIVFPDSMELIDQRAFAECYNLDKIDFGHGIKTIKSNAFDSLLFLKEITLPESLLSVEENVFANCEKLTTVVFNAVNCEFSNAIFPPTVTSFTIGDNVKVIPDYLLYGLEKVSACSLPSSLVDIGKYAFYGCASLKEMIIPDGITVLNWNVFAKCEGLEKIVFPKNLTEIGGGVLFGCSNLREIDIPESVTSIGTSAFNGTSFETIKLPENLQTLGDSVFANMKNLTHITIPPSITELGYALFYGDTSLAEFEIPPTITKMGNNVFKDSGVERLVIPQTVRSVGTFFMNYNLKEVVWMAPVEELGANCFSNCENLESISLPNTLQRIPGNSFFKCEKLKEIVIPNSVTRIGALSFWKCEALDRVVMGYGLSEIAYGALELNSSFYITAKNPPQIAKDTFKPYESELYVLPSSVEAYKTAPYWCNFENIKPMVEATSLEVDITEISGKAGDEIQLTATILPEEATLHNVFWTTSNPDIATVDTNGLVRISSDSEECTLTAESLYPDVPPVYITVNRKVESHVEENLVPESPQTFDVYTLQGIRIRHAATRSGIDSLPAGLYIVNGKKVLVRR
ncbi:MAG: leucine-rich repeat protein [Muribaculaceae bacterium]|nr:leucine-rich repeat protein [Muribaculaceae bacterium]